MIFRNKTISYIRPAVIIITAGAFLFPAPLSAFDSAYPEEPERFDSEYYLDMLTMHQDRSWRALSDGTDNLFSLDFGSLNVEQWVLIQSLKFSAPLSQAVRFRYWLVNNETLGPEERQRNEIEIEWNLLQNYYLSFYLEPSFWKRENDLGIGLQRREGVDSYLKVIFRVRDFANNFAYRRGDNIEGKENMYTRQPLELAVEALDQTGHSFRYGFSALFSTRFEKEYRFLDSPGDNYTAGGYRRSARCWIEKDIPGNFIFCLDAGTCEYLEEIDDSGKEHTVAELFPRLWWYPSGGESATFLPEGAAAFSAGLQLRKESWSEDGHDTGSFEKNEVLPVLLGRYALSSTHLLEAGYLADRYESERTGSIPRSEQRWENRLKLMWEVRLGKRGSFRIIETLDLDREDWGQFSVHDHFFIMSRFLF
ncbi:MAG: hypothetical protein GF417_05810 [Candidatus Latescibacteria bacterium]|nr:hypothetical protein [bacterium]MBD3423932.1 hypothetical protein [Candidatus Latescibacterota bacterium]